ncbi:hypothetical protein BD779DRAFT_1787501 [Infundibulicybe gibba]|nr:hypothetical protein BD779DRAFT_1787501 [Infundibulicybe gibba]
MVSDVQRKISGADFGRWAVKVSVRRRVSRNAFNSWDNGTMRTCGARYEGCWTLQIGEQQGNLAALLSSFYWAHPIWHLKSHTMCLVARGLGNRNRGAERGPMVARGLSSCGITNGFSLGIDLFGMVKGAENEVLGDFEGNELAREASRLLWMM